jgi:hypothetical protein
MKLFALFIGMFIHSTVIGQTYKFNRFSSCDYKDSIMKTKESNVSAIVSFNQGQKKIDLKFEKTDSTTGEYQFIYSTMSKTKKEGDITYLFECDPKVNHDFNLVSINYKKGKLYGVYFFSEGENYMMYFYKE